MLVLCPGIQWFPEKMDTIASCLCHLTVLVIECFSSSTSISWLLPLVSAFISLTSPKHLFSLGHSFMPGTPVCLPHGLFCQVSLPPHCFCSLPLLCVSACRPLYCLGLSLRSKHPEEGVIRPFGHSSLRGPCPRPRASGHLAQGGQEGQADRANGFYSNPTFQTQGVQT